MDNLQYIKVAALHWIVQAIPGSQSGDAVTVEIRRLSDGYTWNFSTTLFEDASNSGDMTFVNDILWKQSFTPPTEDTYIVTVNNTTADVKFVQVLKAIGQPTPAGIAGSQLTTLANVKTALGITNTDDDTLLNDLIAAATAELERFCNRTFASATYTEYRNGDGTNVLLLKQYPVQSITSMHDDTDRVYGSDTLIDADDYVVNGDIGEVTLDGFTFAQGLQNIKIVYVAGYTTIPYDLEQAAIKLVTSEYIARKGYINTAIAQDYGSKPYYLRKDAFKMAEPFVRYATP